MRFEGSFLDVKPDDRLECGIPPGVPIADEASLGNYHLCSLFSPAHTAVICVS